MSSDMEERREIIAKLVATLNTLLERLATYQVYIDCDGQVDATIDFIEKWNNPKCALSHAWGLLIEDNRLRDEGVIAEERVHRLIEAFVEAWRNWIDESPDDEQLREGIVWWCDITGRLGIGEHIWPKVLSHRIDTDYEGWLDHISKLQAQNSIPSKIEPEEYAALVFYIYTLIQSRRLPPKHPVWQALGVNDIGEFRESNHILETLKLTNTENAQRIMRAIVRTANRAFNRNGLRDWMDFFKEENWTMVSDDDDDIKPLKTNRGKVPEKEIIEYMSEEDRLLLFCELIGIDRSILTPGESKRLIEILNALDSGRVFSSKKGNSIKSYYEDKADSEKTQRHRLFKKIREASDK